MRDLFWPKLSDSLFLGIEVNTFSGKENNAWFSSNWCDKRALQSCIFCSDSHHHTQVQTKCYFQFWKLHFILLKHISISSFIPPFNHDGQDADMDIRALSHTNGPLQQVLLSLKWHREQFWEVAQMMWDCENENLQALQSIEQFWPIGQDHFCSWVPLTFIAIMTLAQSSTTQSVSRYYHLDSNFQNQPVHWLQETRFQIL